MKQNKSSNPTKSNKNQKVLADQVVEENANAKMKRKGKLAKKSKSSKSNPNNEYVEIELTPVALGVILGLLLIIFGLAVYLFVTRKNLPVTTKDPLGSFINLRTEIESDDPQKGSKEAKVTIVEFSDFECPFCKRYSTTTYLKLVDEYVNSGKVKYVFRDFIAIDGHNPAALREAVAANCALEQGKYWEYHDAIFNKTQMNGLGIDGKGASSVELIGLAKSIGLNVTQFSACLGKNKQDEVKNDINYVLNNLSPQARDQKESLGTPFFIVCKTSSNDVCDGKAIIGAQSYETFKKVIDYYLAEK